MPPMRLLPNLVLQLEQCGEISMWFLQIIESVLNLEVMKLDFYPPPPSAHTHTHTHTHTLLSLSAFSSLVLRFIVIAKPHFSLFLPSFSFPFLFSTLSSVSIFLRHLQNTALPSLLPSETYTHTHTHTHLSEVGEINSDLNVLSWCVSVVKASVNRVQRRMML